MKEIPKFPQFTDLNKIRGKIINGDPFKEKLLQFADFFTYAPHIKLVSGNEKDARWNEIKDKYYSLFGAGTNAGLS